MIYRRPRVRRRPGPPPVPGPRLPSLDLLLQIAMTERDKQLAHFDALDTKAGVLLAFDGVLISLMRGIRLAFVLSAVSLVAASALFALAAFWPRNYPLLHPPDLRKYLTHEVEQTQLTLHDTIGEMITRSSRLLQTKARNLKLALVLLLLGAVTFGAGIIDTSIATSVGRIDHGHQGPVIPGIRPPSSTTPASR